MKKRKNSYGRFGENYIDKTLSRLRSSKLIKVIESNSRIIDMGCGYEAKLSHLLAEEGNEVVGIDIDVGQSKSMRVRLIKSRVDEKLDLPSSKFDSIVSGAVIEHVDKPETMLREAHRLLRKGGILAVTTPHKSAKPILELIANIGLINREEIDDHKRYYDENSLQSELIDAGFSSKNISIERFMFGLNMVGYAVK